MVKTREADLEPSQTIVPGSLEQIDSSPPERLSCLKIRIVQYICIQLKKCIGVLDVGACCRQPQPLVIGNFRKKPLHQLERKRKGLPHQFGIIFR